VAKTRDGTEGREKTSLKRKERKKCKNIEPLRNEGFSNRQTSRGEGQQSGGLAETGTGKGRKGEAFLSHARNGGKWRRGQNEGPKPDAMTLVSRGRTPYRQQFRREAKKPTPKQNEAPEPNKRESQTPEKGGKNHRGVNPGGEAGLKKGTW